MNRLVLKSPAKINLYLKVLKKRKDGYHDIQTVFERINLCDEIILEKSKNGRINIECSHPDVPLDKRNLAYKAASILKKDFCILEGIKIRLRKRIPVASGLGGGSSDAASVLLGLNRLWNLNLSQKKLLDYATKLGSDVAFFILGTSFALGQGKGERLKSLKSIKSLWHILIIPKKLKVYSDKAYASLSPNLQLTKIKDDVNIFIHALSNRDFQRMEKLIFNALEKNALKTHPTLIKIKEQLRNRGVKIQSLSGSGPAIFGLVRSRKEADILKNNFKNQKDLQVFVVRTL